MNVLRLAGLGVLVQAIALVLFILVSHSEIGLVGKPIVIALACVAMMFILWHAIKKLSRFELMFFPILLACGYVISFYGLGAAFFPGLLKDFEWSSEEALATLRVFSVVVVLYSLGTGSLFLLKAMLGKHA